MAPCKPGKEKNKKGRCVKKCHRTEIRGTDGKCKKPRKTGYILNPASNRYVSRDGPTGLFLRGKGPDPRTASRNKKGARKPKATPRAKPAPKPTAHKPRAKPSSTPNPMHPHGFECKTPYNRSSATIRQRIDSCVPARGGVFDNVRTATGGRYTNRQKCIEECYIP